MAQRPARGPEEASEATRECRAGGLRAVPVPDGRRADPHRRPVPGEGDSPCHRRRAGPQPVHRQPGDTPKRHAPARRPLPLGLPARPLRPRPRRAPPGTDPGPADRTRHAPPSTPGPQPPAAVHTPHGADQRPPGRGQRPGRARPLGGRPHRRQGPPLGHRHAGGAQHALPHAGTPAPGQRRSRCRRRPGGYCPDLAGAPEEVPDLGPGLRNGRSPHVQRHHRHSGLLLQPRQPLAAWDTVAAELNSRPRKTLGWETPAERLSKLLAATRQ
ncbi:hypothetical protein QFZ82_002553 [Streptomyces sp. V4I23]|nr:hypothetical protein [Streptomyces sp. V4I23]